METKEKVRCCNCGYCKIWYDKDHYTMRMSCTKTSDHGKTITWKSYPIYEKQNGILMPTKDTEESITKEFEDYAKRRLAPSWCEYRKTNTLPELKEYIDKNKMPYTYYISYAYSDVSGRISFGSTHLHRSHKIDSMEQMESVLSYIKENAIPKLLINTDVVLLSVIELK